MAYTKRTWLGRQGTGLNKFSIGGASPVTIVNQPDSVTQVGDALSAGNLNDLEDRIESAFDDVDTALDTKADEQDITNLNNAINQLDHRLENIEQAKGDYIVSSYKDGSTTPSGKGKWCVVEGVEGVSRVGNNLIPTNRKTGSYTASADTVSYDETAHYLSSTEIQCVSGHTYLMVANVTRNISTNNQVSLIMWPTNMTGNAAVVLANGESNGQKCSLYTANGNGYFSRISFNDYNGKRGFNAGDSASYSDLCFKDLNVYFGTSDLSFLGATDSAKLATIQTNYPHLLTPSEYGTRTVDSSYSGVRAWARNLWDEVYEEGDINYNTGVPQGNSNYIRSVNFCKVTANTSIYVKGNNTIWLLWYDANYGYLGGTAQDGTAGGTVVTSPANARYFKLVNRKIVFDGKICINVSDSLNGTYTPYHAPNTLSFPSTSLKSAGSVYDSCEPNVEVEGVAKRRDTQRIASVDMGTLNYTMTTISGHKRFMSPLAGFPIVTTENLTSLLCARYIAKGEIAQGYMWGNGGNIYIVDDNYSDADSFKASLSGVMLNYELADPVVTLSDPILDNTLLTEAGGRMATVQTGTVVDGIADLGFITL